MKQLRPLVFVFSLVLLGLSAQSARAELLSNLINGGSLVVGDKMFFNFDNFSSVGFGGAIAPGADEISVVGAPGTPFGLLFQSAKWNVGAGQSMDTLFSFDVEVLNPAFRITAVSGALTGFSTTPNGEIHLDETVVTADGQQNFLASLGVLDPGSPSGTTILPGAFSVIRVFKDLSLEANDGRASISAFTQRFTQSVVPEPGSMALMGTGVVLGGFVWRRRKTR